MITPSTTHTGPNGTKVDLSAEKTDRWRRHPLSAAIAITAEAEPRAILLRQMIRPAPRYPRVVGRVQATTARASFLPSRIGQVLVDRQEERPKTPTSMQLMPYHGLLRGLRTSTEDTPCQRSRSITVIDVVLAKISNKLIRIRAFHIDLSSPRSLDSGPVGTGRG